MKILLLIILALAFLGVQYVIIDKLMSRAASKKKEYIVEEHSETEAEEEKLEKENN